MAPQDCCKRGMDRFQDNIRLIALAELDLHKEQHLDDMQGSYFGIVVHLPLLLHKTLF